MSSDRPVSPDAPARPVRSSSLIGWVALAFVTGFAAGALMWNTSGQPQTTSTAETLTLSDDPLASSPSAPTTTAAPVVNRDPTRSAALSEAIEQADEWRLRAQSAQERADMADRALLEVGTLYEPWAYAPRRSCTPGAGRQPSDYQNHSTFAADVAFYRLEENLANVGGLTGESWAEVFAIVPEGTGPVLLVVPEEHRDEYGLIWNPDLWRDSGDYQFPVDAEPAIVLEPCPEATSTFIGGFVATPDAECAILIVETSRPNAAPDRTEVELPLQGETC